MMNSVALPMGSTAPALSAEADLVGRAGRAADQEAFDELFRRHGQTAWRLAQAVAPDADSSAAAVAEGFARALRSQRRRQSARGDTFRPLVLAAVYQSALEHAGKPGATGTPTPAKAVTGDAAVLAAAFHSLPERWRAALWLHDVEGFETDRLALVLGVSVAVAAQLIVRAERGLAGRLSQARRSVPQHLGAALGPLAAAFPANLAGRAVAQWRSGTATGSASGQARSRWFDERAMRPLAIAAAGVLGLGMIGLGVLGQHSLVSPGPPVKITSASNLPPGRHIDVTGFPPVAFGGLVHLLLGAQPGALASLASVPDPFASLTFSSPPSGGGSAGTSPTPASTGGTGSTTPSGTSGAPGGGTTSPLPGITLPGGITTPKLPPTTGVPGILAVGSTGSSTNVTVLPGTSGGSVASGTTGSGGVSLNLLSNSQGTPTAGVSVGCNTIVGVDLLGIKIGCPTTTTTGTAPATSTKATTSPVTSPLGNL
ncbi:MAG: sigma factor-like helix-turn-helix DNA-binding protein [Acidimicrobiales bacterium]